METDVVVAGSGAAGLVASVRALEQGADVILLEKGHQLGGNAPITGGTIAVDPSKDPDVDAFEPVEDGVAWLEEVGVTIREPTNRWLSESIERIAQIDPPDFVEHMGESIEDRGGTIMLETAFTDLVMRDGEVAGAVAHNEEQGEFTIQAPNVILATGGFVGNEELVQRYLGHTDFILNRHSWSTGDGYMAALEHGAKTTEGLANPVGHSKPAPPAEISFEDIRCDQMYETTAVALDPTGHRFTDESAHQIGSISYINDFVDEVEGTAYLVIDADIYESHTGQLAEGPEVSYLVEYARDLGAPVTEAESLEALAAWLDGQGVDGEQAIDTIRSFNEAVSSDAGESLDPPRAANQAPIDTPPFYAVGVQPGIVFFRGGLDVNHNAEVLSRPRSISSMGLLPTSMKDIRLEPIPGLYAVGIEAGRSENESYYYLGLSLGLATGRIAGKHAAERSATRGRPVGAVERDE